MLYWIMLKVAINSILANRFRSVLSILGIVIGTAAVISMLSLGAGAQKKIMNEVSRIGTNLLSIHPGGRRRGGVRSEIKQELTLEDAEEILKKVPDIKEVAPVANQTLQAKFSNKNSPVVVTGTSITYFSVRNSPLERGRVFTKNEIRHSARAAILGPKIAETLFGKNSPLGKKIKIKSISFKVIGILESKGGRGRFNPDECIFIPYTTAMKNLFGTDYLDSIDVSAVEKSNLGIIQNDITKILRLRHRLDENDEDDFHIFNQADLISAADRMSTTFTILLSSIAGISLFVGGIGIMNIMLINVVERTKEIGIRKAIGARNTDILFQFLMESVLICGLGGIVGVMVGIAAAYFIAILSNYQTLTELWSILMSFSVSVFIGIFFGYYPAKRAAGLSPIEALRHE